MICPKGGGRLATIDRPPFYFRSSIPILARLNRSAKFTSRVARLLMARTPTRETFPAPLAAEPAVLPWPGPL